MSDPLGLKEPMTKGSYTCIAVGFFLGIFLVLGTQWASIWLAQ